MSPLLRCEGTGVFGLRVTGAKPVAAVALAIGMTPIQVPVFGGTLYEVPLVVLGGLTDKLGLVEWPIATIPADSRLCGTKLLHQGWQLRADRCRDDDGGPGHGAR